MVAFQGVSRAADSWMQSPTSIRWKGRTWRLRMLMMRFCMLNPWCLRDRVDKLRSCFSQRSFGRGFPVTGAMVLRGKARESPTWRKSILRRYA